MCASCWTIKAREVVKLSHSPAALKLKLTSQNADCHSDINGVLTLTLMGGKKKGFGFIDFKEKEAAIKALDMDGADVAGRVIKVAEGTLQKGAVPAGLPTLITTSMPRPTVIRVGGLHGRRAQSPTESANGWLGERLQPDQSSLVMPTLPSTPTSNLVWALISPLALLPPCSKVSDCWFCLSNPHADLQLIASIRPHTRHSCLDAIKA